MTNMSLPDNLIGIWGKGVYFISGEWLLNYRANGGDVILLRTLWTSLILYLVVIAVKQTLDPSRTFTFSFAAFKTEAHASLTILGALIAAIYASLYTRYSRQWSYLAGLYNQLMAADTKVSKEDTLDQKKALAYWIASFIEDAEDLHLATKRTFAPAIKH